MLGSARASTQIAKTYDPEFLLRIGVVGIRSDIAHAREWYRQGAERGDPEAIAKLTGLNAIAEMSADSRADVH